jgi:hypothetical protein
MTGVESWTTTLDALEEWVRRTAAGFATRDLDLPADPPAVPSGPVPPALRVRALALLAQLHATQTAGLLRRDQVVREQAYGAA